MPSTRGMSSADHNLGEPPPDERSGVRPSIAGARRALVDDHAVFVHHRDEVARLLDERLEVLAALHQLLTCALAVGGVANGPDQVLGLDLELDDEVLRGRRNLLVQGCSRGRRSAR